MFNFFKKNQPKIQSFEEIIDQVFLESHEKKWFINYFPYISSSQDLIYVFEKTSLELFSLEIRLAILKYYLIENNYLSKLKLKKKQLTYYDEYGDKEFNFETWMKELQSFSNKRIDQISNYIETHTPTILLNKMNRNSYLYKDGLDLPWSDLINIMQNIEEDLEEDISETIDSPYEYETSISNAFSNLGWIAFQTKGSGDQGADVIIEKHGYKFVVQCKLYNQPVGNKAVQEVSSAQAYYEAVGAVVVTNNDYTKSARQLAESQNVWLLHDSQLAEWNNLMNDIIKSVNE